MDIATLIPGQTRISAWAQRLHNWLDQHPVTLDEVAYVSEQEAAGPSACVPQGATQLSSEGEYAMPPINAASRLARHEAARLSKRMVV